MAWKRSYKKKAAPRKKKTWKKKAAAPALKKLQAAVKKLNTVSYDKIDMVVLNANAAAPASPYVGYNISASMASMAPVWGYAIADIANANKAWLNNMKIQVSIAQNNERDLIRYSMFVCSLKDAGADASTFDPATGSLPALIEGTHYVYGGFADQVLMSPAFFNVHATRRFNFGYADGVYPTADSRSVRRFTFNVKPSKKLITNPKGNVFQNAQFNFPKDPSQNYFVLLFNDNSQIDLQSNKLDINTTFNWSIAS
jgi:hypothetical protein